MGILDACPVCAHPLTGCRIDLEASGSHVNDPLYATYKCPQCKRKWRMKYSLESIKGVKNPHEILLGDR